jgi:hypothetical protein
MTGRQSGAVIQADPGYSWLEDLDWKMLQFLYGLNRIGDLSKRGI